ncbi:autotransporter assembly complex protein TamA [Phreatobacter oligotrophus]|jgi:translocation and assembly module TamA|uniref:autotransporter assembly complex protein TamA n=1 Tax=Phreatobacter oligotrophus TaxID=1122261 RepID=UPI003B5B59DB|nr:BamA/TamA family outer membrane protein [Phreatobacter oligotrophus]
MVADGTVNSRRYACLLAGVLHVSTPQTSHAFDFFGLFGERPPAVSTQAVAYQLDIQGLGSDATALTAVRDVSILHRLRAEAPQNGDELVRRAEADLPRIVDALWGSGYYAAKVSIVVGGQAITLDRPAGVGARATIDSFRGRALVPVAVIVETGPLYRFGRVQVLDQRSELPFDPAVLPPRLVSIKPGDPARTEDVLGAAATLADHFRDRSHPFVKVGRRQPVIDHPSRTVDLTLMVDPGARAGIGGIGVSGTQQVDPAVVRSFIYAERGDPYSRKAMADIRRSVARIEAIGGVRVREGTALDANGQLPIDVEVTERPLRVLGGSLRYSTIDGPALKAYWAHRNLFGGAERLRLDADLFYFTGNQNWPGGSTRRGFNTDDIGGRLSASFLKPALWGTRNDLLVDAFVQREITDLYTSNLANATVAVRHRFTDTFNVRAGVEGEVGRSIDVLGRYDYGLVGLPVAASYDTTDRPLDPSRGVRVTATVTPYLGFGAAPDTFLISRIQASAYYAIDEQARTILAGRVAFGSILGGTLADIPASRRFYAGGGGSVRGYEFKSLGPRDAFGNVTGGKSLFEASLEARIRITETLGVVPFFDMGQAYSGSLPDGSAPLRYAAGLGLRYYTAVGPIRFDVAVPLQRRTGERPYAFYVSIGQAF